MKCTSCNNGTLSPAYLEPQLPCHTCSNCGGDFLMLTDFLRWKSNNEIPNSSIKSCEIKAEESSKALLCPKTRVLMTKYKISNDSDHRLDLSPSIDAVWMDKGEWALLKAKGLANNINLIFTDHWQQDIRSAESTDIMSVLYARKFGDHYSTLKEFRSVLDKFENRSAALAYLMAKDPYQP